MSVRGPAGGADMKGGPFDPVREDSAGPRAAAPLVTLVVAMLDEANAIEACLASVLGQDYPSDRLEVLVYDGGSTDGSADRARGMLDGRPLAAVLANPRRIQSAAWNLGIAAAAGDVVGILSGHAELAPGYVRAAVAALERTGADMVGGPVRAIGDGLVAEAIAVATSTSFGAGGARFRLATQVEEVDTVYMGVARRPTYLRFPFDEEMVRDQDDELSYRLLDAGGRIVCDPAIGSTYRSRATLRGLARQYAAYGLWKVRVLQKHPDQARLRHLVPPAFVVAIGGAAALLPFGGLPRLAGASALVTYAVANLAVSGAAARGRPRLLPVLPLVYATLHVAYGAGFVAGLVRFRGAWPAGALRRIAGTLGRRG
jgi:succinoglycan biosynthesis protein ExoA